MSIAVDFSFQKPSVATLKAHGVVCVIVYLTGAGKAITQAEVESYLKAGIVTVFVFEAEANDAAGGMAAGIAHAAQARSAITALLGHGWGDPQPVYFAVDENVPPSAVTDYFVGINRGGFPRALCGAYGDGQILNYLGAAGLAAWFFQSNSKSFPGNATTIPAAHIQQKYNASPIPGTDLDVLLQGDVGQWPRPT